MKILSFIFSFGFVGLVFLPLSLLAKAWDSELFYQQLLSVGQVTEARLSLVSMGLNDSNLKVISSSETPEGQRLIDHTVQILLKTPTGKKLCTIVAQDPLEIIEDLGVSQGTALDIHARCSSEFGRVGPNYKKPFRPAKKYFFVHNVPENFPFQSWTDSLNQTFIFFDTRLSSLEISSRIIHEIAVSFDQKLTIGTETGLYGMLDFDASIRQLGTKKATETEIRRTLGIVPIPLIKFSLAVLRAKRIEIEVLSEMYGPDFTNFVSNAHLLLLLRQEKYEEALRITMQSLVGHQLHLLPLEYNFIPMRDRVSSAGHLLIAPEKIQTAVEFLSQSALRVNFNQKLYSVLDWLTQPYFGLNASFFNRGPRPRIGGGWGELSDPRGLQAQLDFEKPVLRYSDHVIDLSKLQAAEIDLKKIPEVSIPEKPVLKIKPKEFEQ